MFLFFIGMVIYYAFETELIEIKYEKFNHTDDEPDIFTGTAEDLQDRAALLDIPDQINLPEAFLQQHPQLRNFTPTYKIHSEEIERKASKLRGFSEFSNSQVHDLLKDAWKDVEQEHYNRENQSDEDQFKNLLEKAQKIERMREDHVLREVLKTDHDTKSASVERQKENLGGSHSNHENSTEVFHSVRERMMSHYMPNIHHENGFIGILEEDDGGSLEEGFQHSVKDKIIGKYKEKLKESLHKSVDTSQLSELMRVTTIYGDQSDSVEDHSKAKFHQHPPINNMEDLKSCTDLLKKRLHGRIKIPEDIVEAKFQKRVHTEWSDIEKLIGNDKSENPIKHGCWAPTECVPDQYWGISQKSDAQPTLFSINLR